MFFTKAAARRGGEVARQVAALPSPAAAVPGRGAAALLGVATSAEPRAAGVAPRSPRRRLERGLEGARSGARGRWQLMGRDMPRRYVIDTFSAVVCCILAPCAMAHRETRGTD